MNRVLARILSGLIRDKTMRHAVRDVLLGNPGYAYPPELEEDMRRLKNVASLHEYVAYYGKIGEILSVLRPYSVVGVPKVRIGGKGDGGYVMLDPGRNGGVAYSFGISTKSPWDIEMASRGYDVFQFDGTIETPPDTHPNLHFQKVNIVSQENDERGKGKSIDRLFCELGHEAENDIILQMDIEGGEWEVLQNLSEPQIKKFRQIIIEFHGITPISENISDKLEAMKTISRTHKPIHVHLNNSISDIPTGNGLLLYSPCWEVTYARAGDYEWMPCGERFPTPLDSPNIGRLPEIELGVW